MKIIYLLFAVLTFTALFSQNSGVVKGNITDIETNNEPILFANVAIKNTNLKTKTNLNGNFEITDVAPGTYSLEISFLGYETAEIPLEIKENEIVIIHEGLYQKSISTLGLTASNDQIIQRESFLRKPQ